MKIRKKKYTKSIDESIEKFYPDHLKRDIDEIITNLPLLRLIKSNPNITQREISKKLGISLGKTNYIIRSFIKLGLIKLDNFKRSDNKASYRYLLTKRGFKEKLDLTQAFLIHKISEYNKIETEIEELNDEISLLKEKRKKEHDKLNKR